MLIILLILLSPEIFFSLHNNAAHNKTKDSSYLLYLRIISKDFMVNKKKKLIERKSLRLSVSYKTINVKDIGDIHKYLMEKLDIV